MIDLDRLSAISCSFGASNQKDIERELLNATPALIAELRESRELLREAYREWLPPTGNFTSRVRAFLAQGTT